MKINTGLDFLQELKPPLPEGEYVLEYNRDGFSNHDTVIDIYCTVVQAEDPKQIGQPCKIQTCYSHDNKRIVAIGNSIRNQIFKACIGKELFESECKNGGINTTKLYGLRFKCNVGIKETSFGLTSKKNTFSGFKCILSEQEIADIAKERFSD